MITPTFLSLSVRFTLLVKDEPKDIDMVDVEEPKKGETLKKPVKQVAVKKETTNKDTLSDLLSTQSTV